jgi:hypothetical protein
VKNLGFVPRRCSWLFPFPHIDDWYITHYLYIYWYNMYNIIWYDIIWYDMYNII